MIGRHIFAIAACWLLTPFVSLASSIELGSPFCDNAILQREMDLPVWGWSKPGSTVTVEFAGQKATTPAATGGKWMLKLKPLKGRAEPAEMIVSDSEGTSVSIKNILVGEVWMASGQSSVLRASRRRAVSLTARKAWVRNPTSTARPCCRWSRSCITTTNSSP